MSDISGSWATQAMAEQLLSDVSGLVYRPYEARDALLDPAAELGDGITVGGLYSVLASTDTTLDAVCAANISAPGDQEVDHEYPYLSPRDRALKRKVSLGASYYGTKITRKEGLVIEKTDGETVSAKAVLNADELSFYDGSNVRVLYFDPATGTYKFTGVLNVSDNFLVDKDGNVTIKGNLNLSDGILYWGDKFPVKYQFCATLNGLWHNTMQPSDRYRRDSTDNGTTWGEPYQFVGTDGMDGVDGQDGSDANVDFWNIKRALQLANGIQSTFITADSAGAPNIYGGKIYGSEIRAGDGTTGLWVGDDSALGAASSNQITGTGLFISFSSNIIYKYINGVPTEIGGGSSSVTVTAMWG